MLGLVSDRKIGKVDPVLFFFFSFALKNITNRRLDSRNAVRTARYALRMARLEGSSLSSLSSFLLVHVRASRRHGDQASAHVAPCGLRLPHRANQPRRARHHCVARVSLVDPRGSISPTCQTGLRLLQIVANDGKPTCVLCCAHHGSSANSCLAKCREPFSPRLMTWDDLKN